MKFRIVLEYNAETASYSVYCPELPGCASVGDTEDEAMDNIKEALGLYLTPSELDLPENANLAEVTVG